MNISTVFSSITKMFQCPPDSSEKEAQKDQDMMLKCNLQTNPADVLPQPQPMLHGTDLNYIPPRVCVMGGDILFFAF